MAKFYGIIGYGVSKENGTGIWENELTTRHYYGDVIKRSIKNNQSSKINDDIDITNEISIIADPFAYTNFHAIKYVEFMGAKWRVTRIEVQHPRLILSIGGIYND